MQNNSIPTEENIYFITIKKIEADSKLHRKI